MATCIGFPDQRFHSTISASVARMTGPHLIREHEGPAPAVFADLAGHHLAVFRWLEQRAHSAAVNVLWRVLIFSLLPRHFSDASVREIRNKNPSVTPVTTARMSSRRDRSTRFSTMELALLPSPRLTPQGGMAQSVIRRSPTIKSKRCPDESTGYARAR